MSRDAQTKSLSVHRLVQAVLKDGMKKVVKKRWVQRVIQAVAESLPEVEHKHWGQWEQMMVQVLVCVQEMKRYAITFPEATQMLQQTGLYLMERGRYDEAQGVLERAMYLSEQQQGGEQRERARDAGALALLYKKQGNYREAEQLYQRALAIDREVYRADHPVVAADMNNLAGLYYAQEKYAEAEPLLMRTLKILEQSVGAEHPNTKQGRKNYAVLLRELGREEEAAALEAEVK